MFHIYGHIVIAFLFSTVGGGIEVPMSMDVVYDKENLLSFSLKYNMVNDAILFSSATVFKLLLLLNIIDICGFDVGNCYQKVKEETQAMQAKMDPEVRLYNTPRTEVVYVYKGEEDSKNMFEGKYIVEMDKPRPEWFPKNLLTKGHGKY